MWEKFKANFAKHPYIFIGVGVAVILFIFWGGGSGKSSGGNGAGALEANAIAASAQANAQLQALQYGLQGQEAGYNAAISIAQLQTAAAQHVADLQSSDTQFAIAAQSNAVSVAAGAQAAHDNFILASQNSAEDWITHLLTNKLAVPKNLVTSGLVQISDPTKDAVTKTKGISTISNTFSPGSNGMMGAGNSTNPSNSGGDGSVNNN